MPRLVAAFAVAIVLASCTSSGGGDADEPTASLCTTVVRSEARRALDSLRLEQDRSPHYYASAEDFIDEIRPLVADDLDDDLDVLAAPPDPDDLETYDAAASAFDRFIGQECALGSEGGSPLDDDCKRSAQRLGRTLTDDPDNADLDAFAVDCLPASSSFPDLDDPCQAIVYSVYVTTEIEGIFNAAPPTADEERAVARLFLERCDDRPLPD